MCKSIRWNEEWAIQWINSYLEWLPLHMRWRRRKVMWIKVKYDEKIEVHVSEKKTCGNEAIHFFFFLCYVGRIPRLRVDTSVFNVYPVTQYEEAPYRRRRMIHMKTPLLDVLLRYIPRAVYPPENVANNDESEVVVNEQSPVNPPPASTTRSLSYPSPRPPQPLRKYSFRCSILLPTFSNPSLNCTALLTSLSSALLLTSTSHIKLCYVSCSALELLEWWNECRLADMHVGVNCGE